MKPRLRHVAELAGVSQATVSRVLNDRPGVAEPTRRAVLRALAQLGYEPTGLAGTRRRGLVGLVVPELDNPVFPRFAQEIESRLAEHGMTTALCTSTPGLGEREYFDVLLEHGTAGVIVISGEHADLAADHQRYTDLPARGVPVVLVNGRPPDLDLPAVSVDHTDAALQAVAHLAGLGHRRIGLAVGPRRHIPARELAEGYREGLARGGLEHDPRLEAETSYGIEGGRGAGLRLLEQGATGVVCASDLMALGVIRALRSAGRRVPEDVSVVGFDDAGHNAYLAPPLTTVQQPFDAMAAVAVRLLMDRIGDPELPASELRFPPELVVRASTAPPPAPVAPPVGAPGTEVDPAGD